MLNQFNPYVPQYQDMYPRTMSYNPIQPATTKVVNDFSEITVNDTPMNTPFSVFVKSDMSEIQIRKWNNMGQMEIGNFKPIIVEPEHKEPEITQKDLMNYLDERLTKLEQLITPKSKTTKKEVDSE